MKKTFLALVAAAVAGIAPLCPSPFSASGLIGIPAAWAEEEVTFHDAEIQFHFTGEKNLVHVNHLVGMLTDLWKLQKKVFDAKGSGENTVGDETEELLNEANLAASERDYEAAFATLHTIHEKLKESLAKMGVTPQD